MTGLVEPDFTHGKSQTKNLKEQNSGLNDTFGVRSHPTIIIVNALKK